MARKKRIWNDGLGGSSKGGRVKGRDYSYLRVYHGVEHEMNLAYQRLKAQWRYRKEAWDLTFEEFKDIWDGQWHNRGRQPDDYCLTRIDHDGAWTLSNVQIIPRMQHWREQRQRQVNKV